MSIINFLERELEKRKTNNYKPIVFEPRAYQQEVAEAFHKDVSNYFLICWARRMGKDLMAFYIASKQCLDVPNSVVYYVFPTMKQGKMMILEGYTNDKKSIIESVINRRCLKVPLKSDKLYHSDNSLRFNNGSVIYFVGSQDVNNKVGGNLDLLVISEMALIQNKELLTYLIPSVINVGGKILLVSTPRFNSYFNELIDSPNDYYKSVLKATDKKAVDDEGKPIYTDEKLKQARALMSEAKFNQEYLCDTTVANELSIYANSLNRAEFTDKYNKYSRLYISFDLGINDATSLIFVQDNTIIYHYHNRGKATKFYIDYIKEYIKRNNINISNVELILPHDANNRHDAVTHLTSRRQAYEQAGFKNIVVLKAQSVNKSIEVTRFAIEQHKLKFLDSDNVRLMIRLMKSYEYKENKQTGENLLVPVHGRGLSASNTCDSVEYFCLRTFLFDYDKDIKAFEWGNYES